MPDQQATIVRTTEEVDDTDVALRHHAAEDHCHISYDSDWPARYHIYLERAPEVADPGTETSYADKIHRLDQGLRSARSSRGSQACPVASGSPDLCRHHQRHQDRHHDGSTTLGAAPAAGNPMITT